jgi:hypothetical protein
MKTEICDITVDSQKIKRLLVALELLVETDEIFSGTGLHREHEYLNFDALRVNAFNLIREFHPDFRAGLNFPDKSDIVSHLLNRSTVSESDAQKIKTLLVALELLVETYDLGDGRGLHVVHGYLNFNSIKSHALALIREFHGEELDFPEKSDIVSHFLNRPSKSLVFLRDFYRRPSLKEKPKTGPLLKYYHQVWLIRRLG